MKYEARYLAKVDRETGNFKHNIIEYMLQILGEKYYQIETKRNKIKLGNAESLDKVRDLKL